MSETSEFVPTGEGGALASEGERPADAEGIGVSRGLSAVDRPAGETERWTRTELNLEGVQLLSRFLMGAAFMGGDELFERLRFFQDEIDAEPWRLGSDSNLDQASNADLLRYLALGMVARGGGWVSGRLRRGFRAALGVTGWAVGRADRVTDNRVLGPARRRAAARTRSWGEGAVQAMKEGQREEQISRKLAGQTINEIIDEILNYVAENPDMQESIRHLIAQQGVGLANVVADNSRTVTVAGDYVVESLVRRILRRAPRQELPPSPLEGVPQTMYSADAPKIEEDDDGR